MHVKMRSGREINYHGMISINPPYSLLPEITDKYLFLTDVMGEGCSVFGTVIPDSEAEVEARRGPAPGLSVSWGNSMYFSCL